MRSWKRRLLLVAAPLILAIIVAACGGDDDDDNGAMDDAPEVAEVEFTGSPEQEVETTYPEPEPEDLTIGFSNPLDANESVNFEGRAMKLEVEELGGEFVNVDAEGDVDKQVGDVERLVAQQVDAMIVFPLDAQALNPALRRAENAGIPTVGIEVDLDSTDPGPVDTQVWQGRDRMAFLQAQAAAELLPADGTFAQMGFAVAVPSIEKFVERAAFWAEQFGLESVGRVDNPSDDIAGGEQAMTEILGQFPDIDGLIAYNEESATGANAAVRAQGVEDLPLIGGNGGSLGFSSLESGRIDATVQIPAPDVGRQAAWAAYDLAQGTEVPETVVAGEPKVITQETIDEVPTWEETLNDRYGRTE